MVDGGYGCPRRVVGLGCVLGWFMVVGWLMVVMGGEWWWGVRNGGTVVWV